jgi:hypothetical protein
MTKKNEKPLPTSNSLATSSDLLTLILDLGKTETSSFGGFK